MLFFYDQLQDLTSYYSDLDCLRFNPGRIYLSYSPEFNQSNHRISFSKFILYSNFIYLFIFFINLVSKYLNNERMKSQNSFDKIRSISLFLNFELINNSRKRNFKLNFLYFSEKREIENSDRSILLQIFLVFLFYFYSFNIIY
jgi:hypothetical protein